MYRSYHQGYAGSVTFEVRTAGDPLAAISAVREAVRAVDPSVPIINVTTQQQEVENRFQQEQLFAQAGTMFGGLALLVAAVGLFGLMSYSVARRTHEIGIRMALGAERADVRAAGHARIDDPGSRRRPVRSRCRESPPAVPSPALLSGSRRLTR